MTVHRLPPVVDVEDELARSEAQLWIVRHAYTLRHTVDLSGVPWRCECRASYPAPARRHDLPPRWDGLLVEWGEWSETETIFLCGRGVRPEVCDHCGTKRRPLINLGRIWTEPDPDVVTIGGKNFPGARTDHRRLVENISAFRCPECHRDQIVDSLDLDAGVWDLDESDYADEGSWEV